MSLIYQGLDKDIIQARRDYFEKGSDTGILERPVIKSWERCLESGLSDRDKVVFDPVIDSQLRRLKASNSTLLDAASETLSYLAYYAKQANYVVTLTDQNGIALAVLGELDRHSESMRTAFRPGVNFDEKCIGTNAMGCAIKVGQPISIIGSEHFLEGNKNFHCVAAPIFSLSGEVIGTVNISREDIRADFGALALVMEAAANIEQQLFLQVKSGLSLQVHLTPTNTQVHQAALLSFSEGGELLAINRVARKLLTGLTITDETRFEDIFDENFIAVTTNCRLNTAIQPLRLISGLSVFVSCLTEHAQKKKRSTQSPQDMTDSLELGDPDLSKKCNQARRVMKAGLSVLITGETGTGKEVVATYLHKTCLPNYAPFIAVNCAAIPESLIESELFGYVEGAFTGARRGGMAGKIEQANQGTLFLDEIGDMPIALQARLLRVLESGEISPLGSSKPKKVQFNLISATNQNIEDVIDAGQFRKDLFYRINGCRIKLSALSDRPDIGVLIDKVLAAEAQGKVKISKSAMDVLLSYNWPGNVRELCTTLKYALAVTDNTRMLGIHDLPEEILQYSVLTTNNSADGRLSNITDIRALEKSAIRQALQETNDNVTQAAQLLGISRATLYRRLKLEAKASL